MSRSMGRRKHVSNTSLLKSVLRKRHNLSEDMSCANRATDPIVSRDVETLFESLVRDIRSLDQYVDQIETDHLIGALEEVLLLSASTQSGEQSVNGLAEAVNRVNAITGRIARLLPPMPTDAEPDPYRPLRDALQRYIAATAGLPLVGGTGVDDNVDESSSCGDPDNDRAPTASPQSDHNTGDSLSANLPTSSSSADTTGLSLTDEHINTASHSDASSHRCSSRSSTH
ncbi:unnamed protein product [Medioppia subpectinata]|uniref:Uncharacterized protein n=1 Tax=Medioppia subpectinata TaxID=1979941 RepID=A0A7R9PYF1_9ACAR|nr:unnamed protein product [Medioppia subpectinata]CAG2105846.1 unnamed protein product [Medioppia subpectinata]